MFSLMLFWYGPLNEGRPGKDCRSDRLSKRPRQIQGRKTYFVTSKSTFSGFVDTRTVLSFIRSLESLPFILHKFKSLGNVA